MMKVQVNFSTDDVETWRKFKSLIALENSSVKDKIMDLVKAYIREKEERKGKE